MFRERNEYLLDDEKESTNIAHAEKGTWVCLSPKIVEGSLSIDQLVKMQTYGLVRKTLCAIMIEGTFGWCSNCVSPF